MWSWTDVLFFFPTKKQYDKRGQNSIFRFSYHDASLTVYVCYVYVNVVILAGEHFAKMLARPFTWGQFSRYYSHFLDKVICFFFSRGANFRKKAIYIASSFHRNFSYLPYWQFGPQNPLRHAHKFGLIHTPWFLQPRWHIAAKGS